MNYWILAFLAGMLGSVIGGNGTFMMTGFVGIVAAIVTKCGGDASLMNNEVLGCLLMPCVCFNGANAALAYSANVKHYLHNGQNLNRSMLFTQDPIVLLIGGAAGVLGYGIYYVGDMIGIPCDLGALSVTALGLVIRFLWGNKKYINNQIDLKQKGWKGYLFQAMVAAAVALVMGKIIEITGITSLGFSISALSLVFMFLDPFFPATHHITMVTGYAIMATGSYPLTVLFAVIAHMIFLVACQVGNENVDTHLDGPAIAIMLTSLMIFVLF